MASPVTRRLLKWSVRLQPCQDVLSSKETRRAQSSTSVVPSACPFHQIPSTNNTSTPTTRMEDENYKSYEEIPSPKGLPILGTLPQLLLSGGAKNLHEYCHRRHQQLGPIFKEKLGSVETVAIAQKDFIQQVFAMEGKYPVHYLPDAWVIYNEKKGIKRGLFFMDGEEWNHRRKLLNPLFVNMKELKKNFGPAFNDVVTDTLDRWDKISKKNGSVLPNLEDELYKWSAESLGMMIFGRRLGCVQDPSSKEDSHDFVHCIQQVFVQSVALTMIDPKVAYYLGLPVWKRFEKAATDAIERAREYVEAHIAETKEKKQSGQQMNAILPNLMANREITHDEIVNTISDLILAAGDTTSHAVQWALYLLARNPDCQEKLLAEMNSVVPSGCELTAEHTDRIPYCTSIIKETLRMYPIASFITRILPKDIILGGYKIPAGKVIAMSQYTVGRDPQTFEDPDSFVPERWLRHKNKRSEERGHACMPFSMGPRSCIGKRVAEEQMRLLLSRVVQNYRLELRNESEVKIALRMVTTPAEPIQISFQPRSK